MKKLFFLFFSLLGVYIVLHIIYYLFIDDQLFVFPSVDTAKYSFVNRLTVESYCEPLPCRNFYIAIPKEVTLENEKRYCEARNISGNRFLEQIHHGDPIPNLGNDWFSNCGIYNEITCQKGQTMLILSLISLLPFPRKEPSFFYCNH